MICEKNRLVRYFVKSDKIIINILRMYKLII